MIDNEIIQEELEKEQTSDEIDVLETALMAALLLSTTDLFSMYGTDNGLNMARSKRKKRSSSALLILLETII